jgi:hypothetical protein
MIRNPITLRGRSVRFILLSGFCLALAVGCALWAQPQSQNPAPSWKQKFVETIQARSAGIKPRKIKTRGKFKVARWEDVDAQFAEAVKILDAKTLLMELHPALQGRAPQLTFESLAEIDQMLGECKVSYHSLFLIEQEEAHFPLTNSVLRLTDDEAFTDLEVLLEDGFSVGTYAGKYLFEKTGGVSYGGGNYRLTFFQYRDNEGNLRPSGNANLLDTYRVRWKEIRDRAFLRFSSSDLLR